MLDLEVRPACAGEVDLVIGVDIAIGLLDTAYQRDEIVHKVSKLRVRVRRVDAGGGIQPFEGIRIGKEPALTKSIRFACGDAKILDTAGGFKLFPLMEYRSFSVDG